MGMDKALLRIDGASLTARAVAALAARFGEVLVAANGGPADAEARTAGARPVPDRIAGGGPLAGIAGALAAARSEAVLVIPCDLPEIDFGLVDLLLAAPAGFDCAVPLVGADSGGRPLWEPLFALYRKSALPAMDEALAEGRRGVQALLPRLRVRPVDFNRPLPNLNTPDDLRSWLAERAARP